MNKMMKKFTNKNENKNFKDMNYKNESLGNRGFANKRDVLKIVSLGGFGKVTENIFVYEYLPNGDSKRSEVLVIDCGMGFPSEEMFGVDLVIPDASYLQKVKDRIKGIVITHGHEDHFGALAYILPKLQREIPVFASKWTKALIEDKLQESGISKKVNLLGPEQSLTLGSFKINPILVTHSIPDTYHLAIETPLGIVYHGSDFKFDWTPIDGKTSEVDKIAGFGRKGILCLLSDCLRSERSGFTPSESTLTEMFERETKGVRGRVFITTMSSNIFRWQQAIDASIRYGRKILLLGMSVEKNIKIARALKYINLNDSWLVDRNRARKIPPEKLTVLIGGSQGQIGSSLERMALGVSKMKIKPGDKVIFSTDTIPGNEPAVYRLIDELTALGAEVSYTAILDDLHVSGHAAAEEIKWLIALTKAKYLVPIGGGFRQMKRYQFLAQSMGYAKEQILLPRGNKGISLYGHGTAALDFEVSTRPILIDGLGIGDVGNIVLRDRKVLSEEGILVVVIPVDLGKREIVGEPTVISRGFVFVKESGELLGKIKAETTNTFLQYKDRFNTKLETNFLREQIQGALEKSLLAATGRQPMILPVIIEV